MQENKVNAPEVSEEEQLIEQARIRREKLAKLVSEGKNPYEKVKYPVDAHSEEIKNNFEAFEGKTVTMAGRMMSRRIMGKASFSHIADKSGSIQVYITRQDIGEENYASYKKDYDIGDIFGFKGFVFKTQTGEISIHVTELTLLSKSLLPLPEKYNGLQDKDMKYRLRHLDLIMNDDVKQFRWREALFTLTDTSKALKEYNPNLEITCCVHATLNSYYVTELRGYDNWDMVASCPYFDVFSTTIINWTLPESFFREITERTVNIAKKFGKESERWLMGYNKRPQNWEQIDKVVDMYEELGVDRLATWTYRGGYGTSVAAKDPIELWDRIGENYNRVLVKE